MSGILGACTCQVTSCENVDDVGCGGTQTETGYCDGNQLFYDASSFIYDQSGVTCNALGGYTTLECSCEATPLTITPTYSAPDTTSTPIASRVAAIASGSSPLVATPAFCTSLAGLVAVFLYITGVSG
jgi:hypothetical protein